VSISGQYHNTDQLIWWPNEVLDLIKRRDNIRLRRHPSQKLSDCSIISLDLMNEADIITANDIQRHFFMQTNTISEAHSDIACWNGRIFFSTFVAAMWHILRASIRNRYYSFPSHLEPPWCHSTRKIDPVHSRKLGVPFSKHICVGRILMTLKS
jgi:hypothetical protein